MKFLHLDDALEDAKGIAELLDREFPGCAVERIDSREHFLTALQGGDFDVGLADYWKAGRNGLSALAMASVRCPDKPFIFVSASIGEERVVEALHQGATDFVLKKRLTGIIPAVKHALVRMRSVRSNARVSKDPGQFRQIAEQVSDLMVLVGAHGQRIYANAAYQAAVGCPAGELDRPILRDVVDEDRALLGAALREVIRSGTSRRAAFRINRQDGTIGYLEAEERLLWDGDSGEGNVLIVARDVTEQRQTEVRIREQAELLDKAQDAIMVQDLHGVITYWNKGAEHVSLIDEARGPTILLVDDEEMIRDTLSLLLKAEGFRVFAAPSGDEALRLLPNHSHKIELLLTDISMDGMTDQELVEAVRKTQPRRPIIALTETTTADLESFQSGGRISA